MNIDLSLLPVADLSAMVALHAEEVIREYITAKTSSEFYRKDIYFTLHVPSQTFGLALTLGHLLGYTVNVNTVLNTDEWKLVGSVINQNTYEFDTYTAYSPGV